MKGKKNRCSKVAWLVAGSVLTVAGLIFIRPLILMYGNIAYNISFMIDEIDFDGMGPEIVPFSEEVKEKE